VRRGASTALGKSQVDMSSSDMLLEKDTERIILSFPFYDFR
jgi:hypothetical protein